MVFQHLEAPHPAASEAEFLEYAKRARQGDDGAVVALRASIYYAMSCAGPVPDYIRQYLANEYRTKLPNAAPRPPNRPNHGLRDQNLVQWIKTARFVRDMAKSAPNINAWAEARAEGMTASNTNADIYRSAAKCFGLSAKRCKTVYEAAMKSEGK